MEFLWEISLFLAKSFIFIVAILLLFAGLLILMRKGKGEGKSGLKIKKINEVYDEYKDTLESAILDKKAWNKLQKEKKHAHKKEAKSKDKKGPPLPIKSRIYVLDFEGDLKASRVKELRREITAILTVAQPGEEVVIRLESPGGLVAGYGLAASQLERLRAKEIYVTVCVDKVAASGGYLMACIANQIIAAPFSYIGSIGVVAQLPNFNRLLKEKNIDFEQLTAGEYKRTLTMFGKNTEEGREKMQEELEEIHNLFKEHIHRHRPQVDIKQVATGEYWLASKAYEYRLVDVLQTSDDYLLKSSKDKDIYKVCYFEKKPLSEKLFSGVQGRLMSQFMDSRLGQWIGFF